MAIDFTKSAATALRLIRNAGQTGTIVRVSAGTYDAVTGGLTGTSETTTTCDFVELPKISGLPSAGYLEMYKEDLIAGRVKFMLIAASSCAFAPVAGDIARLSSVDWEILGSTPVQPDGTGLLYKVGIRQK